MDSKTNLIEMLYNKDEGLLDCITNLQQELQKFKGINQQGFSWGVAQEVLDKMKEIKECNNDKNQV